MGTISLDAAIEAWHAARAAEQQATADLVAAIETAMQADIVDAKLDYGRIFSWLAPIKARGLTETTRKGLVSAMELARNNMGAT